MKLQKQLSVGVLTKRCFENMQKIYKRTPMPKCNFNKVGDQLYPNHTSAWVFSCKFAAYFENTFLFIISLKLEVAKDSLKICSII